MTDLGTNAALRTIIQTLLEMPDNSVRPANQNAPMYKGEIYMTVQIISEVGQGTDDSSWQDVDGDDLHAIETMSGVRITSANIQHYNGDAIGQLRLLADRLQSYMGTQYLEDAGFGYIVVASITDLTGLLPDAEYQTRATMRFDFYTEHNDQVVTPLIVQLPPIKAILNVGLTTESEVTNP
jgi:hypothetical protein